MSMQPCCPSQGRIQESFEAESGMLKAVADQHRLSILAVLARAGGEVCVCDFTEGLPLNQPTVSHHLRVLREAGLVTCERRGTWVYYRLAGDARERLSAVLHAVFKETAGV